MLSVRLEHGVPINTLFFYPMTFGSALYFVGLEAWPTFFLVAFLVLYLLMQWVPFDAHHGDPLVQIGKWADKVMCCSLKVEILFLEKTNKSNFSVESLQSFITYLAQAPHV